MKRIIKGDNVFVRTGKSKGHIGKVLAVVEDKVLVEGANLMTKHVKPNPNLNEQGGIKQIPAPIHVSNLAIYNPSTGKPDKIGFKFVEHNGQQKKVRFFKSNQELVNPL
ncbi:MAG: 50S ribosomal protein L24 [Gammaproteobacteria bacterium]|nr:50S ribosomal protein L24 [Gammaproteobacteria bacterium]